MNARGERIIVVGDSLSKHGADSSPEIWDVDVGSGRQSSAPGDLLASLLAEQGASAVRVNARVGRSAWNFWQRENTAALLASDQGFAPTKVVIILGTNDADSGVNVIKDKEAMIAIRDAYKKLGAEVWAIGPFISSIPATKIEPIVIMMKSVFGGRFIDGRPLSVLAQHAGDGVHYSPTGARVLALAAADALMTKMSPSTIWATVAIGAAGLVGVLAVGAWWSRRHRTLADGFIDAESRELSTTQLQLAAPADEGYRVAYSVPVRRGGKIVSVRAIVDAPRALTLAEAEKWRRQQPGTAWIETMDGTHVPVKGAKRAPPTTEDIRSGEAHAALSSKAPELKGADDEADEDVPDFGEDSWFERLNKKSNARKAGMRKALAEHNAVFITHGDRKILLIKTPEMSNPEEGPIRVMTFDADGPIGHTTRKTLDKIADELTEDWHPQTITPATTAEVDAFTGTEKFAKGSEAVMRVQRANLKGPKADISKLVEDRDAWPDLTEIRKRQPRPLNKLYGKNPTPEQIAASKAAHSAWNSEYRKASKLYKQLVEESNRRFRVREEAASDAAFPENIRGRKRQEVYDATYAMEIDSGRSHDEAHASAMQNAIDTIR